MLAAQCQCDRPRLLEPPTCHRCGHDIEPAVTASTWQIALAIARIAVCDPRGRRAGIDQFSDH